MPMPREIRPPKSDLKHDDILTSHEVAHYIKMNPSSVNKWVKEGRITAFRTPGGHRRVKVSDLHAFLIAHSMPVPDVVEVAMMTIAPEPPRVVPKSVREAVKRKGRRR